VLATYARHQGMPVEEFGYLPDAGTVDLEDLEGKIDDLTAAVWCSRRISSDSSTR